MAKKSSPWPFEFGSETYADWSAPLESALRSEQTKLACLHGASDWVAAMAVMTASNCAAANMRKAQPRQRYGLFALLGGKAMSTEKISPNSAEIVAQLEAGRKGVKAKFWFISEVRGTRP